MRDPRRAAVIAIGVCLAGATVAGCSENGRAVSPAIAALQREARPIGRGPGFLSRARGPIAGPCRRALGRRVAVHVEVFARNRVVLVPTGVGVARPWRALAGRITAARCYGAVVTLDPTGVVLVRAGTRATLSSLFHGWGTALSPTELAGFHAPGRSRVRAYVDGRHTGVDPRRIPLTRHAEIVVEVGPFVPPHHRYAFAAPY